MKRNASRVVVNIPVLYKIILKTIRKLITCVIIHKETHIKFVNVINCQRTKIFK